MSARDTTNKPNDANAASSVVGSVEACRDGKLIGWAHVPGMPLVSAIVDFSIGSQSAGSTKANLMRPDLRKRGIRDGFAGFDFTIPEAFRDGSTHRFSAIERVSQTPLQGLSTFRCDARAESSKRSQLFAGGTVRAHSVSDPRFLTSLKKTGRLALLCAYAPDGRIHGFHRALADGLSRCGFTVLFIQGVDGLDTDGVAAPALPEIGDGAVIKDNRGYDFGSWFAGLELVDEYLSSVREVMLVNDSVFGPLQGGEQLARLVEGVPGDVLGMTDSYEHSYHLQSYFILLREPVVRSGVLREFAAAYAYADDKRDVVFQGELALTKMLMDRGHACSALFPYEVLARKWLDRLPLLQKSVMALPEYAPSASNGAAVAFLDRLSDIAFRIRGGEPLNPCHAFWDVLVDAGMPFIKRELLFKNPMNMPLLERAAHLISSQGYPIAHIRDAAKRYGTSRVFF